MNNTVVYGTTIYETDRYRVIATAGDTYLIEEKPTGIAVSHKNSAQLAADVVDILEKTIETFPIDFMTNSDFDPFGYVVFDE